MAQNRFFNALEKSDTSLISSTILSDEVSLQQHDFLVKHITGMSRKGMQIFVASNLMILLVVLLRIIYVTALDYAHFEAPLFTGMFDFHYDRYIMVAMLVSYSLFMVYPSLCFGNKHSSTHTDKAFQRCFITCTYVFTMVWLAVLSYYQHQVIHDATVILSIQPALIVLIPISYIGAILVIPHFSMVMLLCLVLNQMLGNHSVSIAMSILVIGFLMSFIALIFYAVRRAIGFIAQIEYNNFKLTKKLIHSLNMDALLSIPNRQAFFSCTGNKLARKKESSEAAAVLMIDVDHFKKYNDRYGHPAGDRCLQKVAGCLQSCVREDIDFVGRYGGEEFIVFLDATDADGAQRVATRIRERMMTMGLKHEASETASHVTLSIGIAPWQFGKTLEQLCEQADKALYAAKHAGRHQHVVYEESPDASSVPCTPWGDAP